MQKNPSFAKCAKYDLPFSSNFCWREVNQKVILGLFGDNFNTRCTLFVISVRVKGGMKLQNDMWHGLRKDKIMLNVIYAELLMEIN